MASCVIFGGTGYIGTHLARHFLSTGRFDHVHLADLNPSQVQDSGISASITDVRQPIPATLTPESPSWIFNLAAVHREPGHEAHEYFDTNLAGARHVCDYANAVGCQNIYFTSSISVYGPTHGPTDEDSRICPNSPYGGSKYPAEVIHEGWRNEREGRKLIICRPGVVYGPGDPGNMLRMIRAVMKGYFAYPGSLDLHKSYAYIYGLLDSVDFTMERVESTLTYNYVESPTEPLRDVVEQTKSFVGSRAPVFRVPRAVLSPVASLAQVVLGSNNPIHPVRVRKAAMSTHIVPGVLQKMGFDFRYPYRKSLEHWQTVTPEDFQK